MAAFLERNGVELNATDVEAVSTILALAAGELSEAELATWISGFVIAEPG